MSKNEEPKEQPYLPGVYNPPVCLRLLNGKKGSEFAWFRLKRDQYGFVVIGTPRIGEWYVHPLSWSAGSACQAERGDFLDRSDPKHLVLLEWIEEG